MVSRNILRAYGVFYVHLVHFVFIWYILCSFGTFCVHLVHFVFIWYILCSFGTYRVKIFRSISSFHRTVFKFFSGHSNLTWVFVRVTRLVEFAANEWNYTLVSFIKITDVAQNVGLHFFLKSRLGINFDENGLGYILGDFFTNSSGQPWLRVQ
jgi:hypothetical protein